MLVKSLTRIGLGDPFYARLFLVLICTPACSFQDRQRKEHCTMTPKQGDLSLLEHPIAQELLHSAIPARLAYTWKDGTPRVVPIWFHWNGIEIVLSTTPTALKVSALALHPQVAVTIDGNEWPYKVLLLRG